jgi:WD40 repeat protein
MTDRSPDPSAPPPNPDVRPKSQAKKERANPYVGPRALREGEPIFGRDRELRELLNRLIADRLVLLYSPSGAGKSSLIEAGLVPRMRHEKFKVLPTVRVGLEPAAEQLGERPSQFNRYVFSTLLSLEQDNPGELRPSPAKSVEAQRPSQPEVGSESSPARLAGLTIKDYLVQRPRQPDEPYSRLLVFDQFEEILTQDPLDRDGKLAFFEQVGEALLDHDLWALFAIREDFLAGLDPYLPVIPTYLRSTFRLDLLEKQPALLAIRKPLEDQHIDFQAEAAGKLVDDLRRVWVQQPDGSQREEPGLYVEPVQLQVVCRRLYRELDLERDLNKNAISESDVARLGDVNKALGEYYGGEVGEIAARSGVSERAIRDWFAERLITENLLRGQVLLGEGASGGLDNNIIRLLEDAHLVRAENRRNLTWFELAHDRLVRPILEENQAWAEAHMQDFQRLAAEWRRKDRPPALLLRGKDLLIALSWADENPGELNEGDRELLAASREWREQHLNPVQRRAADWEQQGRPEGLLLSQVELSQAEAWLLEHPDEATPLEMEIISASREAVANEIRLQNERELQLGFERQRTRDQELQNQQLRRRNIWLASLAILAILFFLVALFFSYQFKSAASLNAARATEGAITSDANALQSHINGTQAAQNAAERDTNAAVAAKNSHDLQIAQSTSLAQQATAVNLATQSAENESGRATAVYNADLAQASRLSSLVEANINDSTLSALLGVAAYQAFPQSLDGRNALLTGLNSNPRYYLRSYAGSYDDPFLTEIDTVRAMAFSPDGKLLAWCGSGGKVKVWNLEKRALVYDLVVSEGDVVTRLAFSPADSNLLVSGTGNGYLIFWDLSTSEGEGQEAYYRRSDGSTFRVGQIRNLAFSPNGESLAVSGANGNVGIWDMNLRQAKGFIDIKKTEVRSLDWSPSGDRLAGAVNDASGGAVYIWDPFSGKLVKKLLSKDPQIYVLDWSPNGEWLAFAGGISGNPLGSRSIQLYNTRTQRQIEIGETYALNIYMLAFDQDSKILASGSQDNYYSGNLYLYDVSQINTSASAAEIDQLRDYIKRPDVQSLAFAPQGPNRLAYFSSNNRMVIDEIGLLRPLNAELAPASIKGYGPVPPDRYLNPISGLLAIGYGPEMEIRTLTQQGNNTTMSSVGSSVSTNWQSDDVLSSTIGPGDLVATGDGSGKVQVRDAHTRTKVWEMDSGAPVFSLAFSPSGKRIAMGWCVDCSPQDFQIGVFEIGSKEALVGMKSPYEFTSLAFSWDDELLAGGGAEGRIQLWDAQSGKPLGLDIVWDETDRYRYSSVGTITALAFSRDGSTLASGDRYGHIALWDVASRRQIGKTMNAAEAPITGLLFASDGISLVVGAQDGSIQRWDLDPKSWVERLCDMAGRDFNPEELQAYFTGQDAPHVCAETLQPTGTPTP